MLTAMYGRPVRLTQWVPTSPPPRYDGSWDICVVYVQEWLSVLQVYNWLLQTDHDFTSLVLDSITDLQRRCKTSLKGTEALKIQDWGRLLTEMDTVIRGFRDLQLHPLRPIKVVMFIAETRQNQDGKWKPYMQGQIEVALPYWMDVVGYLFKEPVTDTNGQSTGNELRRLLINQHPQFEAGEAVQGRLGQIVDDPNVYRMYTQLFGDPNGQQPVYQSAEDMVNQQHSPAVSG
jgi:hypothetical protein